MLFNSILTATGATSASNIADLISTTEGLTFGINTVWLLLGAMLVFFMQPGFALVEAGFTRQKNTANILMKNLMDFCIGTVLFWIVGYSFMYGDGTFVGIPKLFSIPNAPGDLPKQGFLIFQTVFCATTATIVSGAMAERTKFNMYILYSVIISLIIYPVSGHWTWGGGWLSGLGFHDFAGSSIVHSVGGTLAFIGALILGPRIGKYSKAGKAKAIPGHNLALATLGVFILWFGWFGFNPGSQLAAAGHANAKAISHIFVTTNMAAACGGIASMAVAWFKYKQPSLSLTLNGILAGLVGITAGCDAVSIGGAALIGTICGIVMIYAVSFIDEKIKVDDPVGASSVHGVCGLLGSILVGFFADGSTTDPGILYGGSFHFLGIQILGAIVIVAWAALAGYILFKAIDKIFGLRVTRRIEEEGLDVYEHGETAYNS